MVAGTVAQVLLMGWSCFYSLLGTKHQGEAGGRTWGHTASQTCHATLVLVLTNADHRKSIGTPA
jgi:hypothetical protein